jgi:hypothetical protein
MRVWSLFDAESGCKMCMAVNGSVGCLLDTKSGLACSVNGRVRGCMTFEWNGRWCCLLSAEIACMNGTAGVALANNDPFEQLIL